MEPTLKDIAESVQTLAASVEKQGQQLTVLEKGVQSSTSGAGIIQGAPAVRKGENSLTSRGYSFLKMVGYLAGAVPAEQARIEIDVHNLLQKTYVDGTPYQKAQTNSIMTPFSSAHMIQEDPARNAELASVAGQCRSLVTRGLSAYDPDEFLWALKQSPALSGRWQSIQKDMSWIDVTAGGALVAPPMMGELIELLRNTEALMAAGARDIGMPPQGRITYPRQTSAATHYWVGENTEITASQPGTGDLTLTAKKSGVLVKLPNELYRFPTIAAEAFVRADIVRVMALGLDKALLEDPGSTLKPKGLLHYAGVQTHTASTTGTNGDTFEGEDVAKMIGKVEELNANFTGWIMRPLMYAALSNRRADAVSAGDKKGPFLFDMTRGLSDNPNVASGIASLSGYKAVKSTQISNTRVKGSGVDLTYILGGDFSDFIIAMGGVIEFLVANQGDTMVKNDQTWVRGIQYVDGAPRHEASFIKCDTLIMS